MTFIYTGSLLNSSWSAEMTHIRREHSKTWQRNNSHITHTVHSSKA